MAARRRRKRARVVITDARGVERLPSSVGVGKCLQCRKPCEAGWSHHDPDDGMCGDCAFLLIGPEFVGQVLGLDELCAELSAARAAQEGS